MKVGDIVRHKEYPGRLEILKIDSPVFLVRHNGYTGHYLLSHLTSDSPLSEL